MRTYTHFNPELGLGVYSDFWCIFVLYFMTFEPRYSFGIDRLWNPLIQGWRSECGRLCGPAVAEFCMVFTKVGPQPRGSTVVLPRPHAGLWKVMRTDFEVSVVSSPGAQVSDSLLLKRGHPDSRCCCKCWQGWSRDAFWSWAVVPWVPVLRARDPPGPALGRFPSGRELQMRVSPTGEARRVVAQLGAGGRGAGSRE